MKKLLLLLLAVAMAATSATKGGSLSATCLDCGSGGDPDIVINGTGYQSGGHNQLQVFVYDSPNPVNCTVSGKNGAFTCTTVIDAPGWYSIVAYQDSKTIVAATVIYIY